VQQWHYETVKVKPGGFLGGLVNTDELRDLLNQMGTQGWELVSAFDTNFGQGSSREVILIFKRPAA